MAAPEAAPAPAAAAGATAVGTAAGATPGAAWVGGTLVLPRNASRAFCWAELSSRWAPAGALVDTPVDCGSGSMAAARNGSSARARPDRRTKLVVIHRRD